MTTKPHNRNAWHSNRWRIAAWGIAALILLLPLVAMQFTDEVNWSLFDFAFAAALLIGTGIVFELAIRLTPNTAYRAAVGLALAAAFLLIWFNGAVGLIGSENNPANLLYAAVLAVGIVGSLIVRFRPHGMARALFATSLAQALVGAVALAAGWGTTGPIWPLDIIGLTGFFTALFGGSALLFHKADTQSSPGTEHA